MAKRILTLALALLTVLALFAGCANTPASSQPASQAPATSSEEAKPTGPVFNETGYPIMSEKIEVRGFFSEKANNIPDDPDKVAIWKKLEEVTNIHINWDFETDEESINLYFAGNDLADFFLSNLDAQRVFDYGIEGGQFYDISQEMETLMPHMVSRFKEWPMMEKVIKEIDGSVYTIPQIRLGSTAAAGQIFFRTDLLEKAGVEEPTTVEEFYNVLKVCKEKDITGGYAPLLPYAVVHMNTHIENFLFAAMGPSVNTEFDDDGTGKVVYNRTSEQYKRYLEFVARLYDEGLLEHELYTLDRDTTQARVKAGQAVFMTYAPNVLPEDCIPNDGKVYLDMLSPLTSEWNSEKHVVSYGYLSNNAGGIKKDSPYAKAIMRLLDTAYADEEIVPGTGINDIAWSNGFKGESYTVNEEDQTYQFVVPDDWTSDAWTYCRHNYGWNVKMGVYDFPYLNKAPNNYARELGMTKKNIPYAKDFFPTALMKYTEDEMYAKTNKLADITNYVDDMRAKFITGVASIEKDWDTYCSEIEKMGIADVLAAMQSAYDRWNGK